MADATEPAATNNAAGRKEYPRLSDAEFQSGEPGAHRLTTPYRFYLPLRCSFGSLSATRRWVLASAIIPKGATAVNSYIEWDDDLATADTRTSEFVLERIEAGMFTPFKWLGLYECRFDPGSPPDAKEGYEYRAKCTVNADPKNECRGFTLYTRGGAKSRLLQREIFQSASDETS